MKASDLNSKDKTLGTSAALIALASSSGESVQPIREIRFRKVKLLITHLGPLSLKVRRCDQGPVMHLEE